MENNKALTLSECMKNFNKDGYEIPIVLGKDKLGEIIIKDLVDIPNILMAGATSTGKSVFINSVILTLLTTKISEEVKLMLIDPKMGVEITQYNGMPHLLSPIITDSKVANKSLAWCLDETTRRYRQLRQAHVKKITEYNKVLGHTPMPYIVIIVDEFADLVLSGDDSEHKFQQLAQMGKIVGIHMILSTSCPKKSVFTDKLIKLIPGRIAGALATKEDSERVLDQVGAENLLGNGDMIYRNLESGELVRVQTPYSSYEDTVSVTTPLKDNQSVKLQ